MQHLHEGDKKLCKKYDTTGLVAQRHASVHFCLVELWRPTPSDGSRHIECAQIVRTSQSGSFIPRCAVSRLSRVRHLKRCAGTGRFPILLRQGAKATIPTTTLKVTKNCARNMPLLQRQPQRRAFVHFSCVVELWRPTPSEACILNAPRLCALIIFRVGHSCRVVSYLVCAV
jgi:hypothetical protein